MKKMPFATVDYLMIIFSLKDKGLLRAYLSWAKNDVAKKLPNCRITI
jgi:hypothetical protein